ncbi:MAG: amidophosphoribosyltransferase [Anaerofustis sp.]
MRPKGNQVEKSDKFVDACGVFGIYRQDYTNAAPYVYYGLYALQHRGQESCGIVVNNDGCLEQTRGMGLVSEVFTSDALSKVDGRIAIGHVRYSTAGESNINNAQPLMVNCREGQIAIAHNGNLTNTVSLRNALNDDGVVFLTRSDTEVIVNLIARNYQKGIVEAIKKISGIIRGSYALVLTVGDKLIGVRDPYGIRPLCLGKTQHSYVLASETCALDAVGATFIRDIAPGEIIVIDSEGIHSESMRNNTKKRPCIFEYVYFARPDSVIDDISVYNSRRLAGNLLAKKDDVEADIVIGVPDSGFSAAIGYAEVSGIPYGVGLIKNRYVGRSFIQPVQTMREEAVMLKLNPLKETILGKRVILIDDSIVRGTTSKKIVDMLRWAGAKEVHFRVSSPPTTYPCYFGIDTPDRNELVAANASVEEIRNMIGADSLMYLSIDELYETVGGDADFCLGCFNGKYPVPSDEIECG